MHVIVHVVVGNDVFGSNCAAIFSGRVEAEDSGEDDTDEVSNLSDLHAGEDELEELAVDEARETAHGQTGEHSVNDRVELEGQPPVSVKLFINRLVEFVAAIVCWMDSMGVLCAICLGERRQNFIGRLEHEVVVACPMVQIPIVTRKSGNDEETSAETNRGHEL